MQDGEHTLDNIVHEVLSVPFDRNQVVWCWKCKKRCRVHGPPNFDPDATTLMAVAGTVCTPWSRIGKRDKWSSLTCISFACWAWLTVNLKPHFIVHECTPDFDEGLLRGIFEPLFLVFSYVFCSTQLGWPCKRQRRYSLLILKKLDETYTGL